MYWPLGTPRIYATSNSRQTGSLHTVSYDGLPSASNSSGQRAGKGWLSASSDSAPQDASTSAAPPPTTTPHTPVTPITPLTPGIKPVEPDYLDEGSPAHPTGHSASTIPLHEPILALRVARAGHIFAVITATSVTIWQTKVWETSSLWLLSLALLSDVHPSQL